LILGNELDAILHRDDVQVVDLQEASPLLRHRVYYDGRLLCCPDDSLRVKFETKALRDYVDESGSRHRGNRESLTFTCFCDTLIYVEEAMEKQNITLSIPKDTLLKVKLLAVKRQTSVSGLLTETLETLVQQHLQWLEQGVDLGTNGHILTGRDELHERA
jgi:hypothetical protein